MNQAREFMQEPGFRAALQSFVEVADSRELEWIRELPFPKHSDRGLAFLLMYSALRGLIPESRLAMTLFGLWEKWGQDLFRCSHLKFEDLANSLSDWNGQGEGPLQKVPGVLRSVSDFFFKTGSLNSWLNSCSDGEQVIQTLAQEIFWMGKTSTYRNKPRHFVWLLAATQFPHSSLYQSSFPPLSQGHFRFVMEWATPGFKKAFFDAPVRGKMEKWAQLIESSGQRNKWVGVSAFEGFLEKVEANLFRCQKQWNGCGNCPLKSYCKIGMRQRTAFPFQVGKPNPGMAT
jgi:hypothetical protein